jgi:hypothetical protein
MADIGVSGDLGYFKQGCITLRRALFAALLMTMQLHRPVEAREPSPSAMQVSAAPASLADFAGDWWHHGFGLTVNPDGTADASWRTYAWCGPGIVGPCDRIENDTILDGGHAMLAFTAADVASAPRDWSIEGLADAPIVFLGVQLPIAHGEVVSSTDPRLLHTGPIDLAMLPYDTGTLTQSAIDLLLCRPSDIDGISVDDMTPAQREAYDHRACGA